MEAGFLFGLFLSGSADFEKEPPLGLAVNREQQNEAIRHPKTALRVKDGIALGEHERHAGRRDQSRTKSFIGVRNELPRRIALPPSLAGDWTDGRTDGWAGKWL